MNARRHGGVVVAGALIATLALSAPALTAGPGSGGGGGQPGDTTGSLYADLIIALRAVDGTPILKRYVVPETEETPEATEDCVQPVSHEPVPGLTSVPNPVDGRNVWVLPLQGEWIGSPPDPLPVAEIEACDPWPQFAMFVSEVELERLNLVRTSDQVIADKLGDVEMKLRFAEAIALQSTGRITFDGKTIDASPENAAIYRSLMTTGTIPGLPSSMAGPPATIGPEPDGEHNRQFDTWELAAAAIGAAASKGTPINVDTVEYYNRISGLSASDTVWEGVDFVMSEDPGSAGNELAGSERFVDYRGFTYSRSQTFGGSVTWLDVPTLTWTVSKITDVVPFTRPEIGTQTLSGVVAFAQMADDVRALCNYMPDNTFIPGFTMDLPGSDTTEGQLEAITKPAVDLGTLPEDVFKTFPFPVTASLQNPWGGTPIVGARLRITIDASDALAQGDVTATAVDGQVIAFTDDVEGSLVGWWGPDTGFPVDKGYSVSTTFDATVADPAPIGAYGLKLELVAVADPGLVLARDAGTITVNSNVPTVLWGDPIPTYTTQGTWATIPLRVYAPETGAGRLSLSIAGPAPLAAGNVMVYGLTTSAMVVMPLTPAGGSLGGTWDVTLGHGYTDVTWYANVAAGAPLGDYSFGVSLEGGNTLEPAVVVVFAAEVHGEQPPDAGEDTTAPVVTIMPVGTPGATATFTLTAVDANTVTFECRLAKDGSDVDAWAACTSPRTYASLGAGAYVFSARGTDKALNVSAVATYGWTVADTTAPVVTITPVGTPGATATFTLVADEDGVTFQCQLSKDGSVSEDWAECTSPREYLALATGTYVFSATATDAAGNTSTPITYSWAIAPPDDTTAPVVTITPVLPLGSIATFTLAADGPGVTFGCQLTRNGEVLVAWAACASPTTYTNLKVGTYVFGARGTDAAGNASEPVSVSWTVKRGGRP